MEITSVAVTIDENGISAPTYNEIVEYLKDEYRTIYGEDAYLENDSQDGQWIGVQARAIHDCNTAVVDVYSTFSPKTAIGDALSRNVAINGITRSEHTYSYVDLDITGVSGTEITNGYVFDTNNNKWILPVKVKIPSNGLVIVSARSEKVGSVLAQIGTVTKIGKLTRGWTGVNNRSTSQLGMPVESDLKLRQRQALSVAIPSQSKLDGIKGAVLCLPYVSRCKTYENETDKIDQIGLPPHSVCVVVAGGDAKDIAQTMRAKKSMGCLYYGNTNVVVTDNFGDPVTISIYRPDVVNIGFYISMLASTEYTTEIGEKIKQAIADHVNQLNIGDKILLNKVLVPAGLFGDLDSMTYEIISISIIVNGLEINDDHRLRFNEVAYCDTDNIEINISGGNL